MADKNYVVSLTVDDSGAVAAVNQMTTALDKADTSTQSLKAQLRQMQQELQKMDIGSEEFQKLSIEAGKLKDQINDASEAVRANAGSAFEQLGNNAGLLSQRLLNLDFEGAAQSARALGTTLGNLSFDDLTDGIGDLTKGLGEIAASILKNPLLLLGGIIAGIVIYWDELNVAVQKLNPELQRIKQLNEDLNKELQAQSQSVGKQTAQINALFDAVQNQNKAESERKEALNAINKLYPDVFANQNVDINNTAALTAGKLQLIKAIEAEAKATAAKTLLEKQYQKQFELQVQLQEQQLKVNEAQRKEAEIIATTSRNTAAEVEQFTLKVTQAGNQTANALADVAATQNELNIVTKNVTDIQKIVGDSFVAAAVKDLNQITASARKAAEDQKKIRDAALQERIAQAQFLFELNQRLDAIGEQNAKDIETRITNTFLKYAEKSKLLEVQAFGDEQTAAQLRFELQATEQEKELAALDEQYREKRRLAGNDAELRKQLTEQYLLDEAAIKKKYADEQEARERELNMKRVQMASDAIGALSQLDAAFSANNKKGARAAFNRNKAYGIAQAGIQTGLAVTAALTAGGNPAKLATGEQFVEAGIAAATGIAQIAKIASTKFNENGDSGGGGGGNVPNVGGGGGNVGTVPTFNAMNLAMLQNRPEQTPKAYVLAQDVSSAVEARDKVRDLARIN